MFCCGAVGCFLCVYYIRERDVVNRMLRNGESGWMMEHPGPFADRGLERGGFIVGRTAHVQLQQMRLLSTTFFFNKAFILFLLPPFPPRYPSFPPLFQHH